jgi:hypothetical protein
MKVVNVHKYFPCVLILEMLKCSTNATFNAKMNNTPRKIYINSYIVQGAQTLPRFFFSYEGDRFVLD